MMKIDEFINTYKLTISNVEADSNPNIPDFNGDHWESTISMDGRTMTIPFSKGKGYNGAEPTLVEVLECIALDISGYLEADSFDYWCDECGYNNDSIRALRIYESIKDMYTKLVELFNSPTIVNILSKEVEFI